MGLFDYKKKLFFEIDRSIVVSRLKKAVEDEAVQSYGYILLGEVDENSFELSVKNQPIDFVKEVLPTATMKAQQKLRIINWKGMGRIYSEGSGTVVDISVKADSKNYIWHFIPVGICSVVNVCLYFLLFAFADFDLLFRLFEVSWIFWFLTFCLAVAGIIKPIVFRIFCVKLIDTVKDAVEYSATDF